MKETPRTDEAAFPILSRLQSGTEDVVPAKLARELERTLLLRAAKIIDDEAQLLFDIMDEMAEAPQSVMAHVSELQAIAAKLRREAWK